MRGLKVAAKVTLGLALSGSVAFDRAASAASSPPPTPSTRPIPATVPAEFVGQTAAGGTVRFKVPPKWKPAEAGPPVAQSYWWSQDGGAGITISDFPGGSLEAAMAQGKQQLAAEKRRTSIVADYVEYPAGRAVRLRHDSVNSRGTKMRHVQLMWVSKDKFYMLSISVTPEEFDRSLPDFEHVAASLRLP